MRHGIGEALVWPFHAKIGTFHLSCREYAVLPLDLMAILDIRFDGYSIPTNDMRFEIACELLGIPLPLTTDTRAYFRPTTSSLMHTEWLQGSIPWGMASTNIYLRRFFMYFLGRCFFGNNRSVFSC